MSSPQANRLRLTPRIALRTLAILACSLFLAFPQGCGGGSSSGGTSAPAALKITTSSLTGGTVGVAYTANLAASGGSGTGYSWTLASGSLPGGITLASGGALSGTPSSAGTATFTAKVTDSTGNAASASLSIAIAAGSPLSTYEFTGDTSPVHDPSIIRQGSTYYVYVTDPANPTGGYIPVRCSADKIAWKDCGYVFSTLPSWVASTVPGANNIWAPDLSFFNGTYHLYYAVSVFGTQTSAIGLATSPTLDPTDPAYKWTDQGPVLVSHVGDNFNAIDPNILIDSDGSIWLTYGSYWNGIFQQGIDPATGQVIAGTPYHLAERASSVQYDPIEGSSLVHKGNYYFLFVSWDFCCNADPSTDNYKLAMGRSSSPHGPFLDQNGTDMAAGGGTVILTGDGVNWSATGGATAYIDPTGGDLIVFHALSIQQNYLDFLFVRSLTFPNDWPVIGTSTDTSSSSSATPASVVHATKLSPQP